MKAKILLFSSLDNVIEKIFDWNEIVKTNNGDKLVKELSMSDDKIIINEVECNIITMLSANDFNDTLTANPYSPDYSSPRYI